VSLYVHLVCLNGLLVLWMELAPGVSQQGMPSGSAVGDDDVPASNLVGGGPIRGSRVADGGRFDKRRLLRAARHISGKSKARAGKAGR